MMTPIDFYKKQIATGQLIEDPQQFFAGIAQLVERNLAKVEVASSSLVSRSSFNQYNLLFPFTLLSNPMF